MEEYIDIKSYWGIARSEYITQGGGKLAVILPGQNYTSKAPLLYYAVNIALESGYDALAVEYGFQRGNGGFEYSEQSLARLVEETKEAVEKCIERKAYNELLFIGKSLGTLVQIYLKGEFKEYNQKHVFLTPLTECVSVIKETECFVAVGTRDRVFKKEHLDLITGLKNVKLMLIDGADHRLEKGNHTEDMRILTQVSESIYEYINVSSRSK